LVARATLAPSTHNAQPWRWTVHPDYIELELDDGSMRRLAINDLDQREAVISCGAALLTFRVAAAQALFDVGVDVLPDPHRQELLACMTLASGAVDAEFATLDDVVPLRRTAWAAFEDRLLPEGLVERLMLEAAREGAELVPVGAAHRTALADLFAPAVEDREFVRQAPFVAVLATSWDTRSEWIAAGQALARVLLTAADHGVSAGLLNAPCQVESDRAQLEALLAGTRYPHLVLRFGYPVSRAPATARRPVDEVMT
jgi:nitroreductase